MGGYALTIPANLAEERFAGARLALRSLTSASATKLYLINGSLASPRVSVSRDPEVQALSPLIAAIDDMAANGYVRMWPRPPVPAISDVIAIAGQEVHDLLSGVKWICGRGPARRAEPRRRVHARAGLLLIPAVGSARQRYGKRLGGRLYSATVGSLPPAASDRAGSSLRGAKRRSNPGVGVTRPLGCFAALAVRPRKAA